MADVSENDDFDGTKRLLQTKGENIADCEEEKKEEK